MKAKSFSLIEVLMAMGVFLFACSALFGLLMSTTKVNIDAVRKSQASLVAAREIGKIQEVAFGSASPAGALKEDPNYKGIMYQVTSTPVQGNNLTQFQVLIYTKLKYTGGNPSPVDTAKPDQVYTLLVANKI